MNQYSRTPEYTVAESEKTHLTERQLDYIHLSMPAIKADLEELCLVQSKLVNMCLDNVDHIQGLLVSLSEQV